MTEAKISKLSNILDMIAEDMANDAKDMAGKPFNGRTVGEAFGRQGAAIAALANIIKEALWDTNEH